MMTMLPELFMSVPAAYWLIVRPATWTIQGALQWQPSSLSTGRPPAARAASDSGGGLTHDRHIVWTNGGSADQRISGSADQTAPRS